MSQVQVNFLDLIEVRKVFQIKVSLFEKKQLFALNNVSLTLAKGKTVALVGESGCGKTTLGKVVSGLYCADSGKINFRGEDITRRTPQQRGPIQKHIQMIFQDPYSSLNPRKNIMTILEQPLKIHTRLNRRQRREVVEQTCADVGIDLQYLQRYPHQFSGGQRQRIAIARAIILKPDLVIADEPISALDVSIQAQIINLMMDLQKKLGLTYLFITHDISVVRHLSDEVAVMYLGEIVEQGPKQQIFANPRHPYTKMLFAAVPDFHGETLNESLLKANEIPSPIDLPHGCFFQARCPLKDQRCQAEHPALECHDQGVRVRCFKA